MGPCSDYFAKRHSGKKGRKYFQFGNSPSNDAPVRISLILLVVQVSIHKILLIKTIFFWEKLCLGLASIMVEEWWCFDVELK